MNEEYLKGYFNTYVKPKKSDAVYEDWVAKIATNEEYKRGMFDTYVKPKKSDATYEDWNTKIFGTTQPTVEQKKNQPISSETKTVQTVQETKPITTGQVAAPTATNQVDFDNMFGSFIGDIVNKTVSEKQTGTEPKNTKLPYNTGAKGINVIKPSLYVEDAYNQAEQKKQEGDKEQVGYGKRADGTEKGTGYFGELKRPDGDVSTELSIGVEYDGKETEIPLLVPTLTRKEVDWLLAGNEPTEEIINKADAHARMRMKEGKSPFAEVGEEVSLDVLEYGSNVEKKIVDTPTKDDMAVLTGQPNPYPFGQDKYFEYNDKQQELKQFETYVKDWNEQTGYDVHDYLQYSAMYELEYGKWLKNNPDPTQEQFDKFNEDVWNQFNESKKISLSNADGNMSSIETIAYRADYAVNSIMSNTLVGKGVTAFQSAINSLVYQDATMGEYYRAYQQGRAEKLSKYKDLSTLQEIAESAYIVGVDFLPFAGMSSVSTKVANTLWKSSANMLKQIGVPANIAEMTAVKAASGILKQGIETGLTLFQYEAAQEATNQLATKKISELDEEAYTQIMDKGKNSFMSGVVVGIFGGISEMILQRVNSQMLSRMYKLDAETGKMVIMGGNKTLPFKLINTTWWGGSAIAEGGLFAVTNELTEKGNLDEMTTEKFFEEGFKFMVGIKTQGIGAAIAKIKSGYVQDRTFKKELAFTGKYNMGFSPAEFRMMGVKDITELKTKIDNGETSQILGKDVPYMTRLKVLYGGAGLMANKTFDIAKSEAVYSKKDKKWYLYSTDKNGALIDIRECANKAEAKELEFWADGFNMTSNLIKDTQKLSPENVRLLNNEYSGKPDALITLNEGLRKAPSNRTPQEIAAISELKSKMDVIIKQQEANDAEIAKRIDETKTKQNDTQDKSGLSGEVGKGQEPIEAKPIEETSGKEVEASRDVQAPEKEIVAEKESKGELAMKADGGGSEIRLNLMSEIRKGANEVKKNINLLIRDVRTKINDAKESGKLSEMEHSAILTGLEKATKGRNFETKKQALLDYVEKKLVGAEMRQDIQTARTNISKLKNNIRNKRQFYGDKFEAIKEATNIDLNANDAETIKQYNEIVSEFLSRGKQPTKEDIEMFKKQIAELEYTPTEKKAKTKEDLFDYIINIASAAEITDANSFRSVLNKVRRAGALARKLLAEKKITEAEYKEVMAEIDTNSDSLTSKLKEKEAEVKKDLTKSIDKTQKEIVEKRANKEDFGLNDNQKILVDNAMIKLKSKGVKANMTVSDAALIEYGLQNIKDGFFNGDTYEALNRISALSEYGKWSDVYQNRLRDNRAFRRLAGVKMGVKIPFTQKVIKTKDGANNNTAQTVINVINSLDSHRIGQYFGDLKHDIMNALVGTTTRNIGTAKRKIVELSKPFNEASRDLRNDYVGTMKAKKIVSETKGDLRRRFTGETKFNNSKRKISFILTEKMWQNNEKPVNSATYWDYVFENVTADRAKNPKEYEKDKAAWKELKADKTLWNKDGSLNYDEAYKRLSPAEKKYFDAITKLNEKMAELIKDATEINGRKYIKINEYDFLHRIMEMDRGADKKDEPKNTKQLIESFVSATKEAGSTFERNMIPKYIDTNLDRVIREQIKDASYNVFVSPDFMANQRAIQMVKNDIAKEQKVDPENTIGYKVFNAFQETAIKRLVVEQNKEILSEADRTVNSLISFFSKKILAMPTRIINELTTNVTRQLMAQYKYDIITNKTDKEAYGNLISDYIHNSKDYGNYSEYYGEGTSKLGKSIEWLLTFSDKAVVPVTFRTEFNTQFKRETGKEFDAERYNNDYMYRYKMSEAIENASIAAIARSEELFNVKTPLGASPNIMLFKLMGKAATMERHTPISKAMFFLQSFNHNELNQVKRSFLKIKNGIAEKDIVLALKGINDFAAISVSNFMYLTIGRALREMSKPMFAYLFSGGDKDDVVGGIDENMTKFIEENMTSKALKGQLIASLYSLSLGKYGAITPVLSGYLLGAFKSEVNKGNKEYDEMYAAVEDMAGQAFVKPINTNEYGNVTKVAKMINPVISEIIVALETLQMGGQEFVKLAKEDEEVDDVNMAIFLNSLFNYAFLNPMSNYIDKQLRYYKRTDEKLKKEKEKKDKKSGNKRVGYERKDGERKPNRF